MIQLFLKEYRLSQIWTLYFINLKLDLIVYHLYCIVFINFIVTIKILYLKENAPDFYKLFQNYTSATSLTERFEAYSQMFESIWTNEYKKWTKNDEIILK